jgi:hypothetical protein
MPFVTFLKVHLFRKLISIIPLPPSHQINNSFLSGKRYYQKLANVFDLRRQTLNIEPMARVCTYSSFSNLVKWFEKVFVNLMTSVGKEV